MSQLGQCGPAPLHCIRCTLVREYGITYSPVVKSGKHETGHSSKILRKSQSRTMPIYAMPICYKININTNYAFEDKVCGSFAVELITCLESLQTLALIRDVAIKTVQCMPLFQHYPHEL